MFTSRPRRRQRRGHRNPANKRTMFRRRQPRMAITMLPSTPSILRRRFNTTLDPTRALLPRTTRNFQRRGPTRHTQLMGSTPIIRLRLPTSISIFNSRINTPMASAIRHQATRHSSRPKRNGSPPRRPLHTLSRASSQKRFASLRPPSRN